MTTEFQHWRPYLGLFLLTLIFRVATAVPLEQAGYMDASYTIHVAENLARGDGFVEYVLWNYLDNPTGLPHPSNTYWMPLPALLVAPFFFGLGVSYRVAQIPFILLSSLLPLFAFYLARRILARDDYAWAAAIFTACSGFYTIYWVSPDNFTPFALTASVCLYMSARGVETQSARYFFAAGIFAALSHLSRADGVLLLAIPPIALIVNQPTRSLKIVLLSTGYCLLGYLLLLTPWFARNCVVIGAPYPSAGTKTLWLTNYDELFRFADDLTWQRYLAWGMDQIVASKLTAAARNVFIIVFSTLQIALAPFAVIGVWQLRRRRELQAFLIYATLLYLVMTFAFTLPSWRGSLFHSASAFLPFCALAVPPGIEGLVRWVARRRRTWDAHVAARVFLAGFAALAIFLSIYLYASAVFPGIGASASDIPLWNLRDAEYPAIARWLDQNARADDLVLVVDPPGFYNVSHRRAIAIPTDSVEAVLLAAKKFGARYLIVQFDHPAPLNDLYHARAPISGLTRVAEFRDGNGKPATLFEIAR